MNGVTFSLCAIKSENGCIRFTNICRFPKGGPKRNATQGWTRASAILNSRKGCKGSVFLNPYPTPCSMPSDKSTSWGSEVRAIYINLITRNDVTSASSKTVPSQPPRIPRHRCSRLRTFFRLFPRPFLQPRASYTPARKTDLRYMIGGKKLLSRPRS